MYTDEPAAFDRTPLTAAVVGEGPRTPFSPERIFVTLPRGNPEIEPLSDASERQGATCLLCAVPASCIRWTGEKVSIKTIALITLRSSLCDLCDGHIKS